MQEEGMMMMMMGVEERKEGSLKCPRCESTNTKFCYYNNYSLSQPRHFCKQCRRYWTLGGALRNLPLGAPATTTTTTTTTNNNSSSSNNNSKRKRPTTTQASSSMSDDADHA